MIEKTYSPAEVEARIAALWDRAEAFRAGRSDRAGAKPYSIVIPPPNVTGSLHMGHALNNTLQDVLARYQRMRGCDVLWQPGMDHAGIATQMVVERQLMERQLPGRREMGREAFVAKVWEWKAESGGRITEQLKRLGASCDFSRERFTMDEGLSRAVAKVFVALHKAGLIYRDKRLVNWDPRFQTAISDLEVQSIEVKGFLWHLRYPIEGQEFDPENPETFITVATTRPETMLGDTAVAVHPDDERYKTLVGRNVVLPLVGRRMRIVADAYSDPEKGTGAVKITPAHDFNDFEVGRRHGLRLINVLDPEAQLRLLGNADFLEGSAPGEALDAVLALDGWDRFNARKRIVEMLEAGGYLALAEPHTHMVPHGDRSGVVIEPYLTDQWYADAETLAQPAMAAVREGRTRIVPENWSRVYFDWLENIQPWCVSRQLWWGHQIPAWYGPDGEVFVEEEEELALAAAERHYGVRTMLRRDEDVLDTWFSSALWPFSTLGWPDKTPELARYYPTSALVTGFDIIFFWVARMMMMGLHFMHEVPFRDVYIHGIVRDEKGAKMSKSKGNVVDPLDLIEEYGADALRFTMAALATPGRDVKPTTARIEGYRNFATKLWNASRFAEMNECRPVPGFDPARVQSTLNRWILGELGKAVGETSAYIEAYRFNDAAAAVYRFIWNVFCDWYVELAKPALQGPDGAVKDETRTTTAFVLGESLKLLHPFMPFVTEALWSETAGEAGREQILALSPWPASAEADAAAEAEIGFVVDLVSEIRSLRSDLNVPPGAQVPLVIVGADVGARAAAERNAGVLQRLARLSGITHADAAPAGSAQIIVRGTVAALALGDVIDVPAAEARLSKEIEKLGQEIVKIEQKLGNPSFVERAPEEVVEEQRERKEAAAARREKLSEALGRLRGA